KHLSRVSHFSKDKFGKAFYKEHNSSIDIHFGKGLPGIVWKNQQTEIWNQSKIHKSFIRNVAAEKVGIKSMIGVPLVHNDNFVGVLVLGSYRSVAEETNNINVFKSLEKFLGGEIKRKQQEEEFHLLFHSAPEILAVASPNGHFVKAN